MRSVPELTRLTDLSSAHVRQKWGRSLLTACGVAMGVALFVGTLTATTSINRSVGSWAADAKGLADVVASPAGRSGGDPFSTAGAGTLPPGEAARVSSLPGVESAAGVFALPTVFKTESGLSTALTANQGAHGGIAGVDFAAASRMYSVELASGSLPIEGNRAVVVTPTLAASLQLVVGDRIAVATGTGDNWLVVQGILRERGLGRFGDVAFADLPTVWQISGSAGGLTQIAVRLAEGTDVASWIEQHGASLPGTRFSQGSTSVTQSLESLSVVAGALSVLSLGVACLAGFLVYLTMSASVTERLSLYGLLAALGASRRQIRRMVIMEATILGVIASVLGTALGIGLAFAAFQLGGRLLASVRLTVPPTAVVLGALLGLGITVVSSIPPAARAAQLDAVEAIRGDYSNDVLRRRLPAVGAILFLLGAAGLALSRGTGLVAVSLPALLAGAVVALPAALGPLAPWVGRLTSRLAPGAGDVAVLHLAREGNRAAYTAALVMVAMALTMAAATVRTSLLDVFNRHMDRSYGYDFELIPASTFDPVFVDRVAALDGVDRATPINYISASLLSPTGEMSVQVRSVDPADYFSGAQFSWRSGSEAEAVAGLQSANSVILPAGTAARLGVGQGDTVTVIGADGPVDFAVVATADIPFAVPTLFVNRDAGLTHFGVEGPSAIAVTVDAGEEAAGVADRLRSELDDVTFLVGTVDDIKQDVRAQVDAALGGFLLLLIMAGGVGLIGLANTLAVSMLRRFREIGILRAIGAYRKQVAAMGVVEALTLVLIALLLAIPLGALVASPLIRLVSAGFNDLAVPYRYPWQLVPFLGGLGVAMAVAASLWPARHVSRLEIDTALRLD